MIRGVWKRRFRPLAVLAVALVALGGTASQACAFFPPFTLLPGTKPADPSPPALTPTLTPPAVVTPPPTVVTPPEVTPPPPGPGTSGGGPVPPLPTQNLPEPATLLTGLVGSGLLGLYAAYRRKKPAA